MLRIRLLSLLFSAAALVALALAAVASAARPDASATALGVRVVLPDGTSKTGGSVSGPPGGTGSAGGFVFPGSGAVAATGAIQVEARTRVNEEASASASASVATVSLFGGEVRAASVYVAAGARARADAAGGDLSRSSISGLVVLGTPVDASPNAQVPLGDWGYATLLEQAVTTEDSLGSGYRGFVVGIHVRLTADHAGYPAGTEIMVGYAEAAVRGGTPEEPAPQPTPPAPAEPTPPPAAPAPPAEEPAPPPAPPEKPTKPAAPKPPKGDDESPAQPLPAPAPAPAPVPEPGGGIPTRDGPPDVDVRLTGDGYVFPVYGDEATFIDDFEFPRGSTGWHHGNDIFAPVGTPILAVADGELFNVGWNNLGGWRLWLRDDQGTEYYYAHLSAFSPKAFDGARVKAGDVIAFMGRSGEAQTTPPHLHFEIHPRELLHLGYDGVINPYPYLSAWRRLEDLPLSVGRPPTLPADGSGGGAPQAPAPAPAPAPPAPEPPAAAVILEGSDISTASGLDDAALAEVLSPASEAPAVTASTNPLQLDFALVVLPLRRPLVGAPPGF